MNVLKKVYCRGFQFAFRAASPNPTVENVEAAKALYVERECQCIIAFGGGSCMDCAKAVGARIAYPRKSVYKMKGLYRS